MGIAEVLFCIFLVLKLTGNVAWSWLWVTSPLWLGYTFILSCMFLVMLLKHPK